MSHRSIFAILILGLLLLLAKNLWEYFAYSKSESWTSEVAIIKEKVRGKNPAKYQIDNIDKIFSKSSFGILKNMPYGFRVQQRVRVFVSPDRETAVLRRDYIIENWILNALLVMGIIVMLTLFLKMPLTERRRK